MDRCVFSLVLGVQGRVKMSRMPGHRSGLATPRDRWALPVSVITRSTCIPWLRNQQSAGVRTVVVVFRRPSGRTPTEVGPVVSPAATWTKCRSAPRLQQPLRMAVTRWPGRSKRTGLLMPRWMNSAGPARGVASHGPGRVEPHQPPELRMWQPACDRRPCQAPFPGNFHPGRPQAAAQTQDQRDEAIWQATSAADGRACAVEQSRAPAPPRNRVSHFCALRGKNAEGRGHFASLLSGKDACGNLL